MYCGKSLREQTEGKEYISSFQRLRVSGFYNILIFFVYMLQTFSEAIRFNVDYGVFEVVNNAPHHLEKQLKKVLQSCQPRSPIYDVVREGKTGVKPAHLNAPYADEAINVNYNIMVRKYI